MGHQAGKETLTRRTPEGEEYTVTVPIYSAKPSGQSPSTPGEQTSWEYSLTHSSEGHGIATVYDIQHATSQRKHR